MVCICIFHCVTVQAKNSVVHVAMETTKTSNFTCQLKSFIGIFFTSQVSACELQPFKAVFSHLKPLCTTAIFFCLHRGRCGGVQLYLNVMLSLKVHCILFSSVGHTTNIQIKPYHASSVRLKEDKNNEKQ